MNYPLTVVRPVQITPEMLVSTDVPETDYPEWAAGTTYTSGARVILAAKHKVYQSTIDANTGNDPSAVVAEPKWLEVGSTNRWKPFDKRVNSQVAQANAISYRFKPGKAVTNICALNIKGATSMRVQMIDSTGVVCDRIINLRRMPLFSSWWAWFFGERKTPTQAILNDLPSYPNAEIQIDFTGTAELAIGVLLLGQARTFALGVQMGASVGIQDYSRKEATVFGDVELVERPFANRANFDLLLTAGEVDAIHQFLSEVRATPCLWVGSNRYEATTVYGFYKSFEIVISYYNYSDCQLELEGLT